MTTVLGLVAIVALLVVGGVFLLRGFGGRKPGRVLGILVLALLVGVSVLFLVWLAIMVIDVGPSMRGM